LARNIIFKLLLMDGKKGEAMSSARKAFKAILALLLLCVFMYNGIGCD